MTLVFRQQKKSIFDCEALFQAAPGSYDIDPPKIKVKNDKKEIPFQSSGERKLFADKDLIIPGPGHYRLSSTLQKGNNQVTAFRSKIQRFITSTKQSTEVNSFNLSIGTKIKCTENSQIQQKIKYQGIKKNLNTLCSNNQLKIPSIPYHKESYGYQPTKENSLKLNLNPLQTYQGTKRQSVGPGHYDIQHINQKNFKATTWSKSKVLREIFEIKKDHISPFKYYIQKNMSSSPQNKKFLSNVPRFYEQKPNLKFQLLNRKFKKQYSLYLNQDQNQKIYKKLMINLNVNKNPGPGYYSIQKSNEQNFELNHQVQCFNSRMDRFPSPKVQNQNKQQKINPLNNIKLKIQDKENISTNTENKQYHETRFSYQKNKYYPGPATYNYDDRIIHKNQSAPKFSNLQRFIDRNNNFLPGPGYYDPKILQQNKKGINLQKTIGRNTEKQNIKNLGESNLSTKLDTEKNQKSTITNSKRVPFNSNQKRSCIQTIRYMKEDNTLIQMKQKSLEKNRLRDKERELTKLKYLKYKSNLHSQLKTQKSIVKQITKNTTPGPGYYDNKKPEVHNTFNVTYS